MIIIGSGALLTIGLLILLVQAIRIAFSLIKIAFYLVWMVGCLVVIVVCVIGLAVQYTIRFLRMPIRRGKPEPEPVVTVNFYPDDEDDGPTIELPRGRFHRLRG
jgi:hypothetical protein